MEIARRIQESMRHHAGTAREAVRSGPFTVYIAPHSDGTHANYAIPDPGARADAEALAELRTVFAEQRRTVRLEYVVEEAPDLAQDLAAGGFTVELDTPVMACAPDELLAPPAPEGVTLQRIDATTDAATLRTMIAVQSAAFGGPPPTGAQVARMPEILGDGLAVLARVGIEPVGAGMFTPPALGVTEVAGIGVLEAYRGRGIAGTVTAELTRLAFRAGVELSVLTPGDEAAGRVYERAGYRPLLHMHHVQG